MNNYSNTSVKTLENTSENNSVLHILGTRISSTYNSIKKRTRTLLQSEKSSLSKLVAQTSLAVAVAIGGATTTHATNIPHIKTTPTTALSPKDTAIQNQKIIDDKLKQILVLRGMKGALQHEGVPSGVNYEQYIIKQNKSLIRLDAIIAGLKKHTPASAKVKHHKPHKDAAHKHVSRKGNNTSITHQSRISDTPPVILGNSFFPQIPNSQLDINNLGLFPYSGSMSSLWAPDGGLDSIHGNTNVVDRFLVPPRKPSIDTFSLGSSSVGDEIVKNTILDPQNPTHTGNISVAPVESVLTNVIPVSKKSLSKTIPKKQRGHAKKAVATDVTSLHEARASGLNKNTLTSTKLGEFLSRVNTILESPSHPQLKGVKLTHKSMMVNRKIKGSEPQKLHALRIFVTYGKHSSYFTLFPKMEGKNNKLVASESNIISLIERKVGEWKKRDAKV